MNSRPGQEVVENLIFDIGSHRGEDTAYYLKRGFCVVAVECAPPQVAAIRSRFGPEIAEGRLTLVEKAIATEAGPVTFYQNKSKSVWGTAELAWAERNRSLGTEVEEVTVEGIPAQDLFRDYGIPFYLKVDIEGRDLLVLRALEGFSVLPPYVSIEAEERSMQALREEFGMLRGLGYDRFKLSAQQHVKQQRVPGGSLQGRPIIWEFEPGSSGLFGEDLPGPWLSAERALEAYEPIMLIYDVERAIKEGIFSGSLSGFLHRFGYDLGWYDTHARHGSWSGRPPRASFSPCAQEPAVVRHVDEADSGGDQRLRRLLDSLAGCGPLQYVPRVCGRRDPGIDEVPEWQVWSERETTPDQKRIETQLEKLLCPEANLLHIGAGNSSLGLRFAPRIGTVIGTTIHEAECWKAESLGLLNYTVVKVNKYSEHMDRLVGPFDFVVDNNPASFACCLEHFSQMLLSYVDLLKVGGLLVMAEPGMRWVVTNNDPNWSLSMKDWERIGQILNMPLESLDNNVFAMRRLAQAGEIPLQE